MKGNMEENSNQETIVIEVDSIKRIALFLEGVKLGRGGNISPLGTHDLEVLWQTIHYLQGDKRYRLK